MNKRFPRVTEAQVEEVTALLRDKDPLVRVWAIQALGGVDAEAAHVALLDGMLRTGITDIHLRMAYEEVLEKIGPKLIPLIESRLKTGHDRARWDLVDRLGDIKTDESRRCVEKELAEGPDRNRRICYIALGKIGMKESETLLRTEVERHAAAPDDALVWALGRCATSQSLSVLRKLAREGEGSARLAGIAALGTAGDLESADELLRVVQFDLDLFARHNAIYALGLLREKRAVPLLLKEIESWKPSGSYGGKALGIYGDLDVLAPSNADLFDVSVHALGRIGDPAAIPEFRRILTTPEPYYLVTQNIAKAAAAADFKELVPDLIRAMVRDHPRFFENDRRVYERISPSLRKLTGKEFGEDPAAWSTVLESLEKKK